MKHYLLTISIALATLCLSGRIAAAQELIPYTPGQEIPQGYEAVDSIVNIPVTLIDTSLINKNIFDEMPDAAKGDKGSVTVYRSQVLDNAMEQHISRNRTRTISGYRVRIFFDNKRTSRADSETVKKRFEKLFPGIKTYRSYSNPYFKVTVGDFRVKSEAMEMLGRISGKFPSAFVVKENIEYPVIDKNNSYYTDTLHFLRPIPAVQEDNDPEAQANFFN